MSAEENRAIARRIIEAYNRHDVSALDGLIAGDYVYYRGPRMAVAGRSLAEFKERVRGFFTAMPDYRMTIEDMVAEGDRVALRYTVHGTREGKQVTISGIDIGRLADGMYVESWAVAESIAD